MLQLEHQRITMIPVLTSPHVLVFKTNIQTKNEAQKLKHVLNKKSILKWNVDVEDNDKVLRIVANAKDLHALEIIRVINAEGIYCEELE